MADNNSLHTEKMSIIRSWGEQDLLQWLDKRHIEKYTLLNFSQKLLHEKKIQQLSFYLPNFSRSFQHWVYFVDFFPYATTSCKRPALSCSKGGVVAFKRIDCIDNISIQVLQK